MGQSRRVQIRQVVLYNAAGQQRPLDLRLGELNIVRGQSRTGKSAVLKIIEYVLGRRESTIPVSEITRTVAWYGLVLRFDDGSEAFVARPGPGTGAGTGSAAMIEIGRDLRPPPFESLRANTDRAALRTELSRLLGITEGEMDSGPGLRPPLQPHVGHAVWLCLQVQTEMANNELLFHRTGERNVFTALQDLMPYFLGAVGEDQAQRQQRLQDAGRAVRRLERTLAVLRRDQEGVASGTRRMLAEARARGLTDLDPAAPDLDTARALDALDRARRAAPDGDVPQAPERTSAARRRDTLRRELRALLEERDVFVDGALSADGYQRSLGVETARLRSVGLLPLAAGAEHDLAVGTCPVCLSELAEADRPVAQMRAQLDRLGGQLATVEASRPVRAGRVEELDRRVATARDRLTATDALLLELDTAAGGGDQSAAAAADAASFTRGRIDLFLDQVDATGPDLLRETDAALAAARSRLALLAEGFDAEEAREQLTSRLNTVGRSMKAMAAGLGLEHSEQEIRLDLRRLTVVADTPTGPVPLTRIGSGENWVGYHLVAHLALHGHFVAQGRPVPRFLVLDQPSQAYYQSEARLGRTGSRRVDDDAVRALYALLRDFCSAQDGRMQIIVTDHASFDDDWFRKAVVEEWDDGRALIPPEWLAQADGPGGPPTAGGWDRRRVVVSVVGVSKKHHFVPQILLRRFADSKKRLAVHRPDGDRSFPAGVNDVGEGPHGHALRLPERETSRGRHSARRADAARWLSVEAGYLGTST